MDRRRGMLDPISRPSRLARAGINEQFMSNYLIFVFISTTSHLVLETRQVILARPVLLDCIPSRDALCPLHK